MLKGIKLEVVEPRRTVRVQRGDLQWEEVQMAELKVGDIFIMFEPCGCQVIDDQGNYKWQVLELPTLTDINTENWQVKCEGIEKCPGEVLE